MVALVFASFVGLAIMIVSLLLLWKSEYSPKRRWIASLLMISGSLLGVGSCAVRQNRECNDLEAELWESDPARVRAIVLGPLNPDGLGDPLMPELFPVPLRIEDRQVISGLLQELKGPSDSSRPASTNWVCRIDLDFGDHQLSCQVFGRPADWKQVGARIHMMTHGGRVASGCQSRRRDPLGVMLEWIALKRKDHP